MSPPCSLCATPLPRGAAACPRCGIAAPRRPSRPARGPFAHVLGAALALAFLGTAGTIAVQAARPGGCEPRTLSDWRAAMRQACVTSDYVCENMTSVKLLGDPELLAQYHAAVVGGDRAAALELEALVEHLRAAYGCAHGEASAAARLPPGHPPVHGLPPGHPPVHGGEGWGERAPGRRGPAPLFEAPATLEI